MTLPRQIDKPSSESDMTNPASEKARASVGDVIELDADTAEWAGFRFAKVTEVGAAGDFFVTGVPDRSDTTFVTSEQFVAIYTPATGTPDV